MSWRQQLGGGGGAALRCAPPPTKQCAPDPGLEGARGRHEEEEDRVRQRRRNRSWLIASCLVGVMALMVRVWAPGLRALRRVGDLSAAESTVQLRRAHFALVDPRDERRGAFRGKSSHGKMYYYYYYYYYYSPWAGQLQRAQRLVHFHSR